MTEQQLIHKMRKELLILRWYVLFLTSSLLVVWFSGFTTKGNKQHFDEIDVERLNVVDSTGKYCFVLTNGSRAPGAIIGGKEYHRMNSNNIPAIIFYNEEGDENGGLLAAGKRKSDGTYYGSSRLVFDRFRRDETIAFQYYEDQLGGYAGMLVQDTREMPGDEWLQKYDSIMTMPKGPERLEAQKKFEESTGPWAAERLFVGKRDNSKSTVVDLKDRKGKTRLLLSVDSLGTPRLEFLNGKGEITYSITDSSHNGR